MSGTAKLSKEISLQTIITDIIKIPGVNVYRTEFLKTAFSKDDVDTEKIINQGPIEANIYANKANERLRRKYHRMVLNQNKKPNVAKTAVTRELACFIWGVMTDHIA